MASNPNSDHQLWTKWSFVVTNHLPMQPSFEEVKVNFSRFAKKAFGSGGQARIRTRRRIWLFEILVDAQVHPQQRESIDYFSRAFSKFFKNGFGERTLVEIRVRLMAGKRIDGRPPDQMIILPRIDLNDAALAASGVM